MADMIRRLYGNFRGVDFRGEEINLSRSPDSLNMWKDYQETESIRTRPGLSRFAALDEPVYGVFFYGTRMLAHIGNNLYDVTEPDRPYCFTQDNIEAVPSAAFIYDSVLYFKDGRNYLYYNGSDRFLEVQGYVPTTSIGRRPEGGGTKYEDVNMLSDYRINTFLATGESGEYYLDATDIDEVVSVTVDGVVLSEENDDYRYDLALGKIEFQNSYPLPPMTDGQDNVVVKFKKTVAGNKERILGCRLLQPFDNRVFFSGNPDFPNTVWHCSLNNPAYCSDLDYYREGVDDSAIRGMVAGNNALWVFREPSSSNTTVFYHTPTLDGEYGKIYPAAHSSVSIGCVGKAINFNDDIVFFSERGMEGISSDVTTEQVIAHRSTLVDRKLTAEPGYRDMILEEWNGYLCVFIGNKVYLADSKAMFTNGNHLEYDWFYWELGKRVLCTCVHDGILYVGTEDGIYSFTDTKSYMESYWVTPKDKFNYPQRLKTTNKRGCVTEATGDVAVYAKTEDGEFEHIGTYENITDYFTTRIKCKKFKDMQLKFHSVTRFSLETVTIEAFIGGYIKR